MHYTDKEDKSSTRSLVPFQEITIANKLLFVLEPSQATARGEEGGEREKRQLRSKINGV